MKKGQNITQDFVKENMDTQDKIDDEDSFTTAYFISNKCKKSKNQQNIKCDRCLDYIKELTHEKKNELTEQNEELELREHNSFLNLLLRGVILMLKIIS